jgi:hypothetical protein
MNKAEMYALIATPIILFGSIAIALYREKRAKRKNK